MASPRREAIATSQFREQGIVGGSSAPENQRSGQINPGAVLTLLAALVIPIYALSRYVGTVDGRILFGVPVVLSVASYLAYRTDKRRAQAGRWRTSEATLHMLEMMGGWPGAFLAQRRYRHKISKVSYQLSFWTIVVVHQVVACDSIIGWKLAGRVLEAIK